MPLVQAKARHWIMEFGLFWPSCVVVAAAGALWLAPYLQPPIQYFDGTISPNPVKVGNTITAHWRIESDPSRVCSAEIVFDVKDGRGEIKRVEAENLPRKIPRTKAPPGPLLAVNVPLSFNAQFTAPPKKAELIITRTFECWPLYGLWPIAMPVERIPFEIVPRE